jgi:hypothetical protein
MASRTRRETMATKAMFLLFASPYEQDIPQNVAASMWRNFLDGVTSTHSHMAATLPYLLRRAEREKMPYVLEAAPGAGYSLTRKITHEEE